MEEEIRRSKVARKTIKSPLISKSEKIPAPPPALPSVVAERVRFISIVLLSHSHAFGAPISTLEALSDFVALDMDRAIAAICSGRI